MIVKERKVTFVNKIVCDICRSKSDWGDNQLSVWQKKIPKNRKRAKQKKYDYDVVGHICSKCWRKIKKGGSQ